MAEEETPRSVGDLTRDKVNEELQHMNELFSKFKDNSELDTVHTNRLLQVLQVFGKNPSQMECNKRVEALKGNEIFELTLEDFIKILDEPWTSINNNRNIIHKAFDKFDHEKDGYIDIEKFREIMRTLGEPLSDEEIDDFIQLGVNEQHKKLDIKHLLNELLGKEE
ncbi:unnamed protein product [Rotaria magnacalcarata]|uniref:EF-hand domain-containing protein n=1 Tax=Rotaria magnacalcarata TaxID=392030 RepID=A0A816V1K8_9BILA|nr:unnamed protein product [Rotaria magnacalcarata]CAF1482649.1 unnamed protein product [Rotaria magnacalcarata]CAF1983849.1 unnamed protein product [Rotaria magnacalcarata]CAF2118157.1 unnamed protein product [Rotaria magnacalcarata]CAF2121180.1 unnamed protein product [Rotaria magnacalcarata]